MLKGEAHRSKIVLISKFVSLFGLGIDQFCAINEKTLASISEHAESQKLFYTRFLGDVCSFPFGDETAKVCTILKRLTLSVIQENQR